MIRHSTHHLAATSLRSRHEHLTSVKLAHAAPMWFLPCFLAAARARASAAHLWTSSPSTGATSWALSTSQPSAVTATMSSMRMPIPWNCGARPGVSGQQYSPGSTVTTTPGSSGRVRATLGVSCVSMPR